EGSVRAGTPLPRAPGWGASSRPPPARVPVCSSIGSFAIEVVGAVAARRDGAAVLRGESDLDAARAAGGQRVRQRVPPAGEGVHAVDEAAEGGVGGQVERGLRSEERRGGSGCRGSATSRSSG